MGLNRHELINNTHFRVLFITRLDRALNRESLLDICEKFGEVETLTLKTKIENGEKVSRGIAIV